MRMKEKSEKGGLALNIQKTKIMTSGPIISWQIEREKSGISDRFYFLGLQITVDSDCSHEIKIIIIITYSRQHIKKEKPHFANKGPCSQNYDFSSSHVQMRELDYKED